MSKNQIVSVELLRGKNYPVLEEEYGSFDTRVVCSLLDPVVWQPLSGLLASNVSLKSHSPFYRETIQFVIPATYDAVRLHVSIERKTGASEFVPLELFGTEKIQLNHGNVHRKDTTVFLDPRDSVCERETAQMRPLAQVPHTPVLIVRVSSAPVAEDEPVARRDDDDVVIDEKNIVLDGKARLVPSGARYIWMSLLLDRAWLHRYTHALIAAWEQRAPLREVNTNSVRSASDSGSRKNNANPASAANTVTANENNSKNGADALLNSVGDVVRLRWCCTRLHQILTRVRLTAERFGGGASSHLVFTPDEEQLFRTERLHRASMIANICMEKYSLKDRNELRDELDHAYAAFVSGVNVGSSSKQRALSYEQRKTIYEAQFTDDDAILLNANMLHFFLPSLPYRFCENFCHEDARAMRLPRPPLVSDFEVDRTLTTNAQRFFTVVVIIFIGSLLDTLTETEVAKALLLFRPAILNAHKCITNGAKDRLRERRENSPGGFYTMGDGIAISHLDKLGRRKQAAKFV